MRGFNNIEYINFGSTYAYYDFIYGKLSGISGLNLASRPQFLCTDYAVFSYIKKKLDKKTKILIVLPDFVFTMAVSDIKDLYYCEYEWLPPWRITNFSAKKMFKCYKRKIKTTIGGRYINSININDEVQLESCKRRVDDWVNTLGIPSVKSSIIPERIRVNIQENVKLLDIFIESIKFNGNTPYIIIPPVSSIMNAMVSNDCIKEYLYNPIKMRKDTRVKVLDYLRDPELQSASLYFNGDCLNIEGARLFTKKVDKDIKKIELNAEH